MVDCLLKFSRYSVFCFSAELIRVFDGNASMKKRLYRTISVPKNAPAQALLVSYCYTVCSIQNYLCT